MTMSIIQYPRTIEYDMMRICVGTLIDHGVFRVAHLFRSAGDDEWMLVAGDNYQEISKTIDEQAAMARLISYVSTRNDLSDAMACAKSMAEKYCKPVQVVGVLKRRDTEEVYYQINIHGAPMPDDSSLEAVARPTVDVSDVVDKANNDREETIRQLQRLSMQLDKLKKQLKS